MKIQIRDYLIEAEFCQVCKQGYAYFSGKNVRGALHGLSSGGLNLAVDCTNEACSLHKHALKELGEKK